MSIGGFVRRLGYRVKDAAQNGGTGGIYSQWGEIRRTLSGYQTGWSLVEQSLKTCVNQAVENCPFYRPFAGQPFKAFPVMNKLGFIEHFDEVRSVKFSDDQVRPISTSGSTGTPFRVLQDFAKRNRVLAELQYFGEIAGYRSHEKMIFFRACHPVAYRKMFWSNVWTLDIASMSDAMVEELYRQQAKGQLKATLAYASTYDILTAAWLKKGYRGNPNMRACFSGSEILRDDVRARCKEFWPNCEVYSRYSNMENGIIAQEAGVPNRYAINWASYYVEILKMDSDETAADGELGRIVVTDMFNRAFPMIRYDTGDLGKMEHPKNDWPVLSSVEGRRLDIIYDANGEVASPHSLSTGLWGLESIKQWQFHQDGPGSYRVTYISDGNDAAAVASLERRLPILHKVFGATAKFTFQKVDDIPQTASHKHKMVVQNWKK